jgi:hypothetical protein
LLVKQTFHGHPVMTGYAQAGKVATTAPTLSRPY